MNTDFENVEFLDVPPSPIEYLYKTNEKDSEGYNFFLFQYDWSKYENYTYMVSTSNSKHTAWLYLSPDKVNLVIVIYLNKIDMIREEINYKLISSIQIARETIETIHNEESDLLGNMNNQGNISTNQNEDNFRNKQTLPTKLYSLFLVSENYLILQCLNRKIILVDFLSKKYSTIFVNSEKRRSIRVISIYDELIVMPKTSITKISHLNRKNSNDVNTPKENQKEYTTRTYVFCISNSQWYFFILNYSDWNSKHFLLHLFPFEENYDSVEDFIIQRIDSKEEEKKWFYIFILLLDGKFIRYVTNWITISIKQVLWHFKKHVQVHSIRKVVNTFDKMISCQLKVTRSVNSISYIILQWGSSDIWWFKFFEKDTPEDVKKRFCIGEHDKISSSNVNNNITSNNNNNYNNTSYYTNQNSSNISYNNNINVNTNDYSTFSKVSHQYHKARQSLCVPPLSNNNLINNILSRTNTNNNSFVNTSSGANSTSNFNYGGQNTIVFNETNAALDNNTTSRSILHNWSSREKEILHYPIITTNPKDSNNNNNNNNNINPNNNDNEIGSTSKDLNNNNSYQMSYSLNNISNSVQANGKFSSRSFLQTSNLDTIPTMISSTYYHLLQFIPKSKSIYIFYYPDEDDDTDYMRTKQEKYFSYHFTDIKIYDILRYDKLGCSYWITNKFILKIRFNKRLYSVLRKSILYAKEKRKIVPPENINSKIKKMIKSSTQKLRCKICHSKRANIPCKQCNRVFYCTEAHMKYDINHFHFFECELYSLLAEYNEIKTSENKNVFINLISKSVNRIIMHILICTQSESDFRNYIIFIQICCNILNIGRFDMFFEENLTETQKGIIIPKSNYKKISERIFWMEAWFLYQNINILYLYFAIRGRLNLWSTVLISTSDIYSNWFNNYININSNISTFSYFGFNYSTVYEMYEFKDNIEEISKDYFFDLVRIYTNSTSTHSKKGKFIWNIYDIFFHYYWHMYSSLLKLSMEVFDINSTPKIQQNIWTKILPHVTSVLEERYYNLSMTTLPNEASLSYNFSNHQLDKESSPQVTLAFSYFLISFFLVKLNKIPHAIKLWNYSSLLINKVQKKEDLYKLFESKILLNNGILLTYINESDWGIHKIEEGYRILFENSLCWKLVLKAMKLLIWAYININKMDCAFIWIKQSLLYCQQWNTDLDKGIRHYPKYMQIIELKSYWLYIIQYIGYRYKKMISKWWIERKDNKSYLIPESNFSLISRDLVGYITQNQNNTRMKEEYGMDESLEIMNNYKEIIFEQEFLYNWNYKFFDMLNMDNSSIKIEQIQKEDNHNEKSWSNNNISSTTTITYNKDPRNLLREEDWNFTNEIEIKSNWYDKLTNKQKEMLKHFNNKLFVRSVILRDVKGKIDKFNWNYHPIYSMDYYRIIEKIKETAFISKISDVELNRKEDKFFEYQKHGIIEGLRNFLQIDKVQNIIYQAKMDFYEENDYCFYYRRHKTRSEGDGINKKQWIKKMKDKLKEKECYAIGFIDNALDNIYSKFSAKELDYIYQNPDIIANYIFIDTKNKWTSDNLRFSNKDDDSYSMPNKSNTNTSQSQSENMLNKHGSYIIKRFSYDQNDVLGSTKGNKKIQYLESGSKKEEIGDGFWLSEIEAKKPTLMLKNIKATMISQSSITADSKVRSSTPNTFLNWPITKNLENIEEESQVGQLSTNKRGRDEQKYASKDNLWNAQSSLVLSKAKIVKFELDTINDIKEDKENDIEQGNTKDIWMNKEKQKEKEKENEKEKEKENEKEKGVDRRKKKEIKTLFIESQKKDNERNEKVETENLYDVSLIEEDKSFSPFVTENFNDLFNKKLITRSQSSVTQVKSSLGKQSNTSNQKGWISKPIRKDFCQYRKWSKQNTIQAISKPPSTSKNTKPKFQPSKPETVEYEINEKHEVKDIKETQTKLGDKQINNEGKVCKPENEKLRSNCKNKGDISPFDIINSLMGNPKWGERKNSKKHKKNDSWSEYTNTNNNTNTIEKSDLSNNNENENESYSKDELIFKYDLRQHPNYNDWKKKLLRKRVNSGKKNTKYK